MGRAGVNDIPAGKEEMCHAWIGFPTLQPEKLSIQGLEAKEVGLLFRQISRRHLRPVQAASAPMQPAIARSPPVQPTT